MGDALRKGQLFSFTRSMLPPLRARIKRLTRSHAVTVYRDDDGRYREVWIPRAELAARFERAEL